MYQIKTLCEKPEKLEREFNKFFAENPNIKVIDMRQSQGETFAYVALTILYEIQE